MEDKDQSDIDDYLDESEENEGSEYSYLRNLNHDYYPIRDATLEWAREVLNYEKSTLEHFGWDIQQISNVYLGNEENYEEYLELCEGLDFGIASVVLSLSAVGCHTFWSCNGSENHVEEVPLVAFFCDVEKMNLLKKAAELSECVFQDGNDGCKEVYGNTIRSMLKFAELLIESEGRIERLNRA